MDDKAQIKSLMKQAELYKSQGLLDESKEKCLAALELIRSLPSFPEHKRAINAVEKKIISLEKEMARVGDDAPPPQLSEDLQDLIKRTFSFSKDRDAAGIEGAVALANFGQHERALAEFNQLLQNGVTPLVAAKNIIRCHLVLSSVDAAVNQFQQWLSGELLSVEQLKKLRSFLEVLLVKKGIQAKLPELVEEPSEPEVVVEVTRPEAAGKTSKAPAGEEEDLLDISSVGVTLQHGPRKGNTIELDVTFQSGNVVSLIISKDDADLVEALTVGIRLNEVQLYSPIAIFRGSGIISGKTQIESGPKQGNYIVNVTIDGTSA